MKISPLILCGGSGTRLWPLSRSRYPKQFLKMGTKSLFEETLERASGLPDATAPVVICNEEHRFLVAATLQEMNAPAQIILEPFARNTAPAVALGAIDALERHDDPLLLVMPSDHVISDNEAFATAVMEAVLCAKDGALVTFGVVPTQPETGYGYIRLGEALPHGRMVAQFTEKPDRETAEAMLADGGFLWNSGIFLFRASAYLEELEKHDPRIAACCREAWKTARRDADFIRPGNAPLEECPSQSIDYAIMEKTDRAVVVPLHAQWSDLGSWQAVYASRQHDADGNVLSGDVIAENARNCHLQSTSRLLAVVGVSDLVVIETPDAVLVADMARTQEVRAVIARLRGRPEKDVHVRTYRPWGSYEIISRGSRYLVKRITVTPGSALSLQRHYHRAEHWIVVRGTAEVTLEDKTLLLHEDESTYVPLGAKHRLANPGKIPLELIEVQTGSYLEEDDIVRYNDIYNRC